MYNAHIPLLNSTNTTKCRPYHLKHSCNQSQLNGWYFGFMFVMWATFTLKELVEYRHCPDKSFYRKQFENIGQWSIIIVDLVIYVNAMATNIPIFDFITHAWPAQYFMVVFYFVRLNLFKF